jgi:hypothetical protein
MRWLALVVVLGASATSFAEEDPTWSESGLKAWNRAGRVVDLDWSSIGRTRVFVVEQLVNMPLPGLGGRIYGPKYKHRGVVAVLQAKDGKHYFRELAWETGGDWRVAAAAVHPSGQEVVQYTGNQLQQNNSPRVILKSQIPADRIKDVITHMLELQKSIVERKKDLEAESEEGIFHVPEENTPLLGVPKGGKTDISPDHFGRINCHLWANMTMRAMIYRVDANGRTESVGLQVLGGFNALTHRDKVTDGSAGKGASVSRADESRKGAPASDSASGSGSGWSSESRK